jgi:hypothetical protein
MIELTPVERQTMTMRTAAIAAELNEMELSQDELKAELRDLACKLWIDGGQDE